MSLHASAVTAGPFCPTRTVSRDFGYIPAAAPRGSALLIALDNAQTVLNNFVRYLPDAIDRLRADMALALSEDEWEAGCPYLTKESLSTLLSTIVTLHETNHLPVPSIGISTRGHATAAWRKPGMTIYVEGFPDKPTWSIIREIDGKFTRSYGSGMPIQGLCDGIGDWRA